MDFGDLRRGLHQEDLELAETSLDETAVVPAVDEDIVEEHWHKVRGLPVPAKQLRQAALVNDDRR
jgi:hypothetical protein